MKYVRDEVRTDWRSRWRGYVATIAAGLSLSTLAVALVLWRARTPPPNAPPAEPAFAAAWHCAPATGDNPVCWRELPPAKPRAP